MRMLNVFLIYLACPADARRVQTPVIEGVDLQALAATLLAFNPSSRTAMITSRGISYRSDSHLLAESSPILYDGELDLVASYDFPEMCRDWTGREKSDFTDAIDFGEALADAFVALPNPHSVAEVKSFGKVCPSEIKTLLSFTSLSEKAKETQWIEFLDVLERRASILEDNGLKVANLAKAKDGVWGSKRQYAFGMIVSKLLKKAQWTNEELDPIWGILLSPTGGIAGAANAEVVIESLANPIILHACVHDAFGYSYRYHNVGPGYNYLGTPFTLFPKNNPLSCQLAGMVAASSALRRAQTGK